jgi:hypothetical protein
MIAIATIVGFLGYSFGFEGYDNGKLHVGVYTPKAEYGWVIKKDEIYLDTMFVKQNKIIVPYEVVKQTTPTEL